MLQFSYCLTLNLSCFQHLAPKDHGSGKCREACLKSLKMLGLDYLDLYLIHWPGASGMRPEDARHETLRLESWRDLEELYDEGIIYLCFIKSCLI